MKQCTGCDRHLFGEEPSCPFCGTEQHSAPAPVASPASGTTSRLASVTLALGLCVAACGPSAETDTTNASSTGDTGLTTTSTSTTTAGITTDDGPSTTTIASTTAGVDSSDDGPASFYAVRPDGPVGPPECDLFAQDCPQGDKCMPWANDGGNSWNATRCSPIADNPGEDDDPCTVEGSPTSGIDDCDLGLMCFDVDVETNQGTCTPLCGGTPMDPTCPQPEQFCAISGDGVLSLCLDSCNPLMPACDVGDGCYPHPSTGIFFCAPSVGAAVYGEACSFINDCAPDHVCLDASAFPDCMGAGCCSEYCDVTAPETCPEAMAGATCQTWYETGSAPPGLENVGVCALPSA
ncbi:hypothetical protein [Paraliomyxa miuraensis]|uniref:hypothetical protein n=1 Tax=Paraliomyxa miuraensis TaxID=376150 RepID=UPI0022560E36|nr:hypothetical protein [Paraliomyxa miuraensis]MCX4240423.1 hypothetical protein [Paraliomyxa miuraensis]